ncbi:penicillin-binding protein 2 [bacterium]|nr:penicillin-binding protein 2 [bacterium]
MTGFLIAIIIGFVVLLSRLWYLQVIQGDALEAKSVRQQIREIRIPAARGIIYDRRHRILAENRPSYNVFYHPEMLPADERVPFLQAMCEELGVDFEVARRRLETGHNRQPIKIKADIDRAEVARIKTQAMAYGPKYPLDIEVETTRVYPPDVVAGHVLGYTDEIDQDRLDLPRYADYRPGDLVGKTGVEEGYEEYLAGVYGRHRVEVNARGAAIRELEVEKGLPGRDLVLNIDADLMKAAAEAMEGRAGAIVAIDPRNGAVRAALSTPGFAPDLFSSPISRETWQGLLNDPKKPLANKFLRGMYPPGSTFKVVTALAALENGVMTPWDVAYCQGWWKFGGRRFRCHNEKGHGFVNLQYGIVHSCDVYFYRMAYQVGIDTIAEMANRLGLGVPVGIDIVGEKTGLVPTRAWKKRVHNVEWYPGDTLSAGIGQGSVLTTPLQMAVAYAAIANGGTVFAPRVVNYVEDPYGEPLQMQDPVVMRQLNFKERNIRAVQDALAGVVNDWGGTGKRAKMKKVRVAGKTGTAQVRNMKARTHWSLLPYEARDHAWFVGYAPAEDPELVVSVIAEHSGHGGVYAAPVVKAVLERYFETRDMPDARDVDEPATTVAAAH